MFKNLLLWNCLANWNQTLFQLYYGWPYLKWTQICTVKRYWVLDILHWAYLSQVSDTGSPEPQVCYQIMHQIFLVILLKYLLTAELLEQNLAIEVSSENISDISTTYPTWSPGDKCLPLDPVGKYSCADMLRSSCALSTAVHLQYVHHFWLFGKDITDFTNYVLTPQIVHFTMMHLPDSKV